MTREIWILGATGRTGREVAQRLYDEGVSLVLAGRSRQSLQRLAEELGATPPHSTPSQVAVEPASAPRLVVGSLAENLARLATETPAPGVVVNTVGPFVTTSLQVARACPPGTHYVDIANEFSAVDDILNLDRQAALAGQVFVTGAGFGVLGTESIALKVCEGRPRPATLRVDALPTLAIDDGLLGAALAGSIVEVLAFGGREVRAGRIVKSATGSHPLHITTLDGDKLFTGSGANGELLAAWRASDADSVVAASIAAPRSALLRGVVLPVLGVVVRFPGVAGILSRVVARIRFRKAPMSRTSTWGHARAEWADGVVREGWMQVGDAGLFTADVMAGVAVRLLRGEGRPGAHTPGALFGPELAEAFGGVFTVSETRANSAAFPAVSGTRANSAAFPTVSGTRTNSAAFLDARRGDFVVGPAAYTPPGAREIVVRNRAVAVNPLDAIKQSTGDLMFRWLPYPSVLGEDVAGEVVEIGRAVTRFAVGDRVLGYAVGMEKGRDPLSEGGFQHFTVLRDTLAAPIPDGMRFEDAVVLPLAVSTAASALFQSDQLGLRHPDARLSAADAHRETVVVWGGSTSVGSNAIQLAVAAGYRVVATASAHNHEYLRTLGASDVVDYASSTVVQDLARLLEGVAVVGVFAIGTGSAEPAVALAAATGAKRVALASPSVSLDALPRRGGPSIELVRMGIRLVAGTVALQVRCRRHGIRARFVWGSTLMDNEVGPMLWERFLPAALADGRYRAAPESHVVGEGLGQVQAALDLLRRGVSARKLVVRL